MILLENIHNKTFKRRWREKTISEKTQKKVRSYLKIYAKEKVGGK